MKLIDGLRRQVGDDVLDVNIVHCYPFINFSFEACESRLKALENLDLRHLHHHKKLASAGCQATSPGEIRALSFRFPIVRMGLLKM